MAKILTFLDDFTASDTAKWAYGANATVAGGQLVVTPTAAYDATPSVGTWDLTDSGAYIDVPTMPNVGNGSSSFAFVVGTLDTADVQFKWEGGTLYAQRKIGGAATTLNSAAYNATNHRWLRISEAGGVITWWTSADGTTWTSFATWTHTGLTPATARVYFVGGYWGTEPTPGAARINGLNVGGTVPVIVPPTVTLADPTPAGQTPGFAHVSGTVNLTATATDDGTVDRVEFWVDTELLATDSAGPAYTATWNTSLVREGEHTVTARAYDADDNVADSTVTVLVNNTGRWAGPGLPLRIKAAAPQPTHLWDYQTGDFSQWEEIHAGRAAQTAIVTSPAREGYPQTARFIVAPGDRASFDATDVERGEVMTTEALTGSPSEGAEQWFAWSTLFPAGFQMGEDCLFLTYTQWHHSGSTGVPNIALMLSRETDPKMLLVVRGGAVSAPPSFDQTWTLTPSPIQRDTWLDHLVYIKWSSNPAVGRVGVWLNGAELLAPTAMPTLYAGQSAYLKQGIYRGACARTHTLYHTGTRRGSTRDSVTL